MPKPYRLCLLLSLAAACLPLAAFAPAEGRFCGAMDADSPAAMEGVRTRIQAALAAGGLNTASVLVEVQTGSNNDSRNANGYLGWVKLKECPDGQVLVRLDRNCSIQNITGRGTCEPFTEKLP